MIQHQHERYRQIINYTNLYYFSRIIFFYNGFPGLSEYNYLHTAYFLLYACFYILFPVKHELTSVFLLVIILFNFIYLSITVYILNEIHFIFSAGFMSIITIRDTGIQSEK